jgi:rare lipoprotein A
MKQVEINNELNLKETIENIIYISEVNENSYINLKAKKLLDSIKELVKDNPNDFELGSKIRNMFLTVFLLFSCYFSFGQNNNNNKEVHKVSYYGGNFHGKKTANGDTFDKNDLTCAATKNYKFGTILKVTNIKNGKSVIVKVTDRGNFAKLNRTLDLSERAFKTIGNIKSGLLKVYIEIL